MPASGAPQGPHANRRSWKHAPSPKGERPTAQRAAPGPRGPERQAPLRGIAPRCAATRHIRGQWRRPDSNRRPPACKAGALPTELRPQNSRHHRRHPPRGDGSRRSAARPARWAGTPCSPPGDCLRAPQRTKAMGQGGLEPPTPRLSSVCSDQLSYWPPAPTQDRRAPRGTPRHQAGRVWGKDARAAPGSVRTDPAAPPPKHSGQSERDRNPAHPRHAPRTPASDPLRDRRSSIRAAPRAPIPKDRHCRTGPQPARTNAPATTNHP